MKKPQGVRELKVARTTELRTVGPYDYDNEYEMLSISLTVPLTDAAKALRSLADFFEEKQS